MDNVYKAPEAALIDPATTAGGTAFFVTSIRKMAILYIATLGMYVLYWGYKQWDSQRHSMPKRIMPVWRSIFIIFFMHSLARRIGERLQAQGQPLGKPSGAATLFVVLVVLGGVLGSVTSRNDVPVILDILALLLQLASLLPMISIQRQANLASGDPEGASNSSMSGSNIAFLILGGLLWLLYLAGLVMIILLGGA
ncbi:MFS transporter permease [Pseudomonas sp. J452]|uniref:MFS transporter permease n=1 Tax=Pseudomonas sp. J452 TaxID=2898441 RepID=UPI0021AD6D47|nr:MFS transporter permease [Pseudomonas sp. J452]UUY08148.1 MFS transporter permease [Pseudomonas sp. J452]